jgi:AcrR family transcriptional regulator
MSTRKKRNYSSAQRDASADATKARILDASKILFAKRGIDDVTIAEIGARAGVAASTVYALFKSKDGLLRGLMTASLFGPRFQAAQSLLLGVTDSARLIALSAHVARAVFESESSDLGPLRGTSGFSLALRKLEQEFEDIRYRMQEERIQLLFAQRKSKPGLDLLSARRILWMYTSRDIYRMLVLEGGWTADRYQEWLAETLSEALTSEIGGQQS